MPMRQAIQKIEGLGVYLAPQPLITVLGVKYLHLRVEDGTDLYVTEYGLPFVKCLMPQNHWSDDAWMKAHSVRLPGTSALHRVTTKTVDGKSKEIVLKWNRMGQDIPGETQGGTPRMRNSTARSSSSAWSWNCGTRDSSRPGGCTPTNPWRSTCRGSTCKASSSGGGGTGWRPFCASR